MLKLVLIVMVIAAVLLLIGLLIYSAKFLNKVQKEQMREKQNNKEYQLHPKLKEKHKK